MFGTLSSCVLVLVVSGAAQIPKEPDFSGDWELVKASGAPRDPPPALTVRQTITRKTVRGEPMTPYFSDLTVQRHFKSGIVSETYQIGIISGTVGSIGEWTTVGVTWEGEILIIRTGKYSGPPQQSAPNTEHEERWSFDPSGRLLIMITDRLSGSPAASAVLIYRRLPNAIALERAVRGTSPGVSRDWETSPHASTHLVARQMLRRRGNQPAARAEAGLGHCEFSEEH
ncbi:MAG TPA: hypothetical protein VFT39_13300 [Vicinamibacterales bacterium]|nr:hypothetical protein [Vicinamibacterales bacterium]